MDDAVKTKFGFIVNRMPDFSFHQGARFPFNLSPAFAHGFWNERIDRLLAYPLIEATSVTRESCLGKIFPVPLSQEQMIRDQMQAVESIKETCDKAEDWGAEVIGLGGVSAIVGSRGEEIDHYSSAAITTGFSYTIYSSILILEKAASELGINIEKEVVVIVEFPGSIASALAEIMAQKGCNLLLSGRIHSRPVQALARKLRETYGVKVELKSSIKESFKAGRIILSATSSGKIIEQAWLLPGSIVIDVGLPKDVIGVKPTRSDVLILDGGYVTLPWRIPFIYRLISSFFGIGGNNVFACLAETMIMAFEDKKESVSVGRNLSIEVIKDIGYLGKKHGFSINNFRSFGRILKRETLDRTREVLGKQ